MTGRIDDSIGRNDDGPKSGNGVGALLRASRIRCGEDLPQVADALRIRLIYLEAIEDGRFADLPGPTYALGFVRTYASHLGLDVEEVIRRLRAETAIETAKPDLSFPIPVSDTTMPTGAVVMIGLIVAAVAYGGYLMNSTGDRAPVADVSPVPKRMMIDAATANAQSNDAPPADAAAAASRPDANVKIETAAGTPAPVSPPPAAQSASPQPASPPSVVQSPSPSPAAQTAAASTPATPASPASASATPSAPSSGAGESQQLAALPQSTPAAPSSSGVASSGVASSGVASSGAASSGAASSGAASSGAAPAPAETPKLPRIEVLAKADSWIQVREGTAGAMLMTRLLRSGETYAVPNRSGLMLLTGNAGALEIRIDGEAVPVLGPEGAVRRSIALDAERLRKGTASTE